MKEKTGKTSVPQIFFHDRHIGGNVELQKLLDSDKDKEEALAELEAGPGDGELPMIPHPSEALEEIFNNFNTKSLRCYFPRSGIFR